MSASDTRVPKFPPKHSLAENSNFILYVVFNGLLRSVFLVFPHSIVLHNLYNDK